MLEQLVQKSQSLCYISKQVKHFDADAVERIYSSPEFCSHGMCVILTIVHCGVFIAVRMWTALLQP